MKTAENKEEKSHGASRSFGRPTTRAARVLHERILEVSFDCFLANGFAGASIEAIAAGAGVQKRTIYRRYETKQNLLVASLQAKFDMLADKLTNIALKGQDLDDLRIVLRGVVDLALEPGMLSLIKIVVSEGERIPAFTREFVMCRGTPFSDLVGELLARLVDAGKLVIEDISEVRRQLITRMGQSDVSMAKMLGVPVVDTPEERDAYFEACWAVFMQRYGRKSI